MKNENIHEIMVHDGNDQGLTTILENLAKTIVHHVMSHCKFQGVESTQKVLFCNQKRSETITE